MTIASVKSSLHPVFESQDFDTFLRQYLSSSSTKRTSPSLRELARTTGISLGSLSMYASGKQRLSEKNYQKLKTELPLSSKELRYLDLLRKLGYGETQEQKLEALDELSEFEEYQSLHPHIFEASKYLSSWINITIRELASTDGFKLEASWIQNRLTFPATTAQVQRAINFLVKNRFIEVDSEGKVTLPEKNLRCDGGTYLLTLAEHHRQMLELARSTIHRHSSNERYLSGLSFSLRKEDLDQVNRILEKTLDQIKELSDQSSNHNSVFHIQIAAFPLAQGNKTF